MCKESHMSGKTCESIEVGGKTPACKNKLSMKNIKWKNKECENKWIMWDNHRWKKKTILQKSKTNKSQQQQPVKGYVTKLLNTLGQNLIRMF